LLKLSISRTGRYSMYSGTSEIHIIIIFLLEPNVLEFKCDMSATGPFPPFQSCLRLS
jgi:hypothetical protein